MNIPVTGSTGLVGAALVARLTASGPRVLPLRRGGTLAKMLPAFRLGLGGRLGTGHQYLGWIALEDLLRVIELALAKSNLSGAVNALSPAAVTNVEFTRALARAVRRPALLPTPAFAVRLLFGERGREALPAIARVWPARLIEGGFAFHFSELDAALASALEGQAS